jgi:D-cysteine desulfhydrase
VPGPPDTALERAFGVQLPRLALGAWPTPIVPTGTIGGHELWLQDEGRAGARYGGNKVRKLEYILGEARRSGVSDLLTVGAGGSHHVLATALYGADHGFRTHAILVPQADTPHARANLAVSVAHSASVRVVAHPALVPFSVAWTAWSVSRVSGRWPRFITSGGSDAVGTLGWVGAGLEIGEAVRSGSVPPPDRVYVAFGSGGTAAGLLLGLRLAGLRSELVAVRVTAVPLVAAAQIRRLARATARHLERAGARLPQVGLDGLRMLHDWYAPGYGRGDARVHEAIADGLARGLALDVTYTGKTWAAARADLASASAPQRALVVHTLDAIGVEGLPSAPLPPHLAGALI